MLFHNILITNTYLMIKSLQDTLMQKPVLFSKTNMKEKNIGIILCD